MRKAKSEDIFRVTHKYFVSNKFFLGLPFKNSNIIIFQLFIFKKSLKNFIFFPSFIFHLPFSSNYSLSHILYFYPQN